MTEQEEFEFRARLEAEQGAQAEPEGKSLAGFGHNVVRNAGEIASGLGNLAVGAVTHPIDTSVAVAESVPGTLKQMAHDYALKELGTGDWGGALKRLGDTAYEKPVSTALDVLPMTGALGKAGKAGVSAAERVAGGMGKAGDWFAKEAAEQNLKALGASTKNVEELIGPALSAEDARNLGNFAAERGIVKPYASAEDMLKATEPLEKSAGKSIENMRTTADLRDVLGERTPSIKDIVTKANQEIGPKYETGVGAGGAGEYHNAIDELYKLNPIEREMPAETAGEYFKMDRKLKGDIQKGQAMAGDYNAFRTAQEGDISIPDVRSASDPLGGIPTDLMAYPRAPETHTLSDLNQMATDLNASAEKAKGLMQPSDATTDVANLVSREANSAIESLLTPEEVAQYRAGRLDYTKLQQIQKMLKHQTAGELSGRTALPVSKFGVFSRMANKIAPHSMWGALDKKLADVLQKAPQYFGKNTAALQEAAQKGGNALGVTMYMLQQRDPEFRETMRKLSEEDSDAK